MKAVKDGAEPRTRLELALVEAASPEVDPSAKALMARLERLEAALAASGGGAPAAAAAATTPAADAPAPSPEAPRPVAAAPAPEAPQGSAPSPRAPTPSAALATAPTTPQPATIDGIAELWPAVLTAIRTDNQLLGAALSEARPVELRGGELVVAFSHEDAFNRRIADSHRPALEEAVRSVSGGPLRVCFELREAPAEARAPEPPPSDDELVARFLAEFDAEEIVPDPDDHEEGRA
jgi:DNA polymerase-3 subunit gamma/tau